MFELRPGDIVACAISSGAIVSAYSEYDEMRSFAIVAVHSGGYYLFVPHYIFLKDTINADQYRCKSFGIDKRYLNENIVLIQENMIAAIEQQTYGLHCKQCNELCCFAEQNQADGSFICYGCRQNRYFGI